jgi:PAS domain-containing protein
MLAMMTGMLTWFVMAIVRPLTVLRAGTEALAHSNFAHRIPLWSQYDRGRSARAMYDRLTHVAELEALATAFNRMAEELATFYTRLEQQVEGRTRALARANADLEREITERRQAEQRFRLAVEMSPDAMIIVNSDGQIVLVNTQAERLFGYARAELLGQMVEMLIPERLRAIHLTHRAQFCRAPYSRPITG